MVKSKSRLEAILKKYIDEVNKVIQVEKAYLFGSYAKGTQKKWSDIDVAIVSKDFLHMDEYIAMVFLSKLKRNVDYAIEAIPLTPDDIANPPLGSIQYTVAKEGKEIKFVKL